MSYTLLAETFPVARKQHRCIWCGEAIPVGMKYRRERSVYDGEMQDHKWHPECEDQFGIECAAEGGTLEFSPHDNDRPSRGVPPSAAPQEEPEPQLVGYEECRCILTQYCDGTCRPVFALPAVLERARTLYANSPGAYRGTRPLPWDRAPMPTRLEFIGRAKVDVGRAALGVTPGNSEIKGENDR